MRYVSVCAGIEAATVAWHPLGWEPVLFSEIEPFPRAVLQHHYPDVPLVGDFTQLIDAPPAADLLVGGTPCQAFSVAGKRLSLEDYRGNLSLAFADLFHAGQYRWAVWENVPGVLSTKDNAFGCFLGRMVGADAPLLPGGGNKWTNAGVVSGPQATAAWRVLDAQYFGVAQRRRRVFVCVSRGAGNWAAAAALLPVGESVSRHPPTRRQAGEGAPATPPGGVGTGREVMVPITSRMCQSLGPRDVEEGAITVGFNWESVHHEDARTNLAQTLKESSSPCVVGALDTECGFGKATDQTVRNGQDVAVPHDPVPQVLRNREGKAGGGKGPLLSENQSLTLATSNDQVVFAAGPAFPLDSQNGLGRGPDHSTVGVGEDGDPSFTLGRNHHHGVIAPTLSATNNPSRSPQSSEVTAQVVAVAEAQKFALRPRRLTPTECERLQGFPDGHTDIPWRKGMAPDGPRYRALGNSMAVPVMHYIGKRIQLVEES